MLDQISGQVLASQWIVFVTLVILLVGLSELPWRIGFGSGRKKSKADKDSSTVRSAVLALLGLLLGFSFAIAAARKEARRELLVEEANSIGTTARRAPLQRNSLRRLPLASSAASTKPLIRRGSASQPSGTICPELYGCFCCALLGADYGWSATRQELADGTRFLSDSLFLFSWRSSSP